MYKDVFYWLYFHLKKMKNHQDTPFYDALLCMIILQGLNLFSVLFIVGPFPNLNLSKEFAILVGVILFALMILSNYLFLYGDRVKIIEEREKYPVQKQQKSKRFFFGYVFISILLFIAAAIYASNFYPTKHHI